jgi:hypothetical protein
MGAPLPAAAQAGIGGYAQGAGLTGTAPATAQPGLNPAYQPYLNAFNQSLQTSRAAIDKQLQQSLSELGQRRDAAAGVVAQLPNDVAQSYAGAQQGLQGAQQFSGTIAGMAPGAAAQANAMAAPLASALAQNRAGSASMVPFLNLANMAGAQGGEALLRQQALAGNQAIDQQQQGFLGNMLQTQMSADLARQNGTDPLSQQLQASGYRTTQGDVNAVQNSPAFARLQDLMNQGVTTRAHEYNGKNSLRVDPYASYATGAPTPAGQLGSSHVVATTSRPTGAMIENMLRAQGHDQAYIDAVKALRPDWFAPTTSSSVAGKKP